MKIYKSGLVLMLEKPEWLNPVAIPSEDSDYQIVATTVQVHDINEDVIYSCGVDQLQDESGALVGDLAAATAYLNNIVGSANEATGGGGAGVETWVYKNSDYIPNSRLFLSHSTFSETVVSENVSLLTKTSVDNPHDGTKLMFSENDVLKVNVSLKIDGNTNNSLVKLKLRNKNGNVTITQSTKDTNIQSFGQFLEFSFSPFPVAAGAASNGIDLTVSDFISTADAFIYNIKITIQKIGTNV